MSCEAPKCGTRAGYAWRKRRALGPCEACNAGAAAAERARHVGDDPAEHDPHFRQRPTRRDTCNTPAGLFTHLDGGEEPCQPCAVAWMRGRGLL